ncbi:tRNA(Ile)-lysidine synthase [Microbulbifer thermotolerans]|uniref:tRNA(Ile)-lysidine synthase n=1 Tax=Microbulbifer thermotolerans TaxID=252514 RepID=A0AB35HZ50_MICTH|nr:tRNA lysidine(34) synthetase TilS [Microbulbifer thermotolerans]MCX2802328.1 tRNA lysidine(34) synthetase TilS [Microbulbifer thermotolerans]SFC73091.1 tRNA(Ile)-lysidine synthase [Microbulbifer thermotolerans]
MNRLLKQVEHALQQQPREGVRWLGFSGGLDSTVLLYLLCELGVEVRAVHVHHGLSPNADTWLAHCAETAEALGVPFTARRVRVDAKEGGLERAAREARYRVFGELLQPGDTLLLAQHGDDQVETFFLRLLRGAGALGLAAMATSRPLGGAVVLRPLLGTSRAELASYARERKLRWIEDESNSDQTLDRNYLRQVVLPPLRERWPVRERVTRAADNLREAAELLRDLGRGDLELCDRRRESFGESLDLEMLRRLPGRRQKNLLRCWLADSGGDMPEAPHLQQALDQALQAGADRRMAVGLGGRVARRYRNRLYLTPPLGRLADGEWHWQGTSALQLPGGWELRARSGWPQGDYTVRFRRGGERARPVGRRHSQTLKKLLQEAALEPWLREWIPLVYRGERLIAVGGLFLCDEGIAGSLEWCYRGP